MVSQYAHAASGLPGSSVQGAGAFNANGNPLPQAPKTTASFALKYSQPKTTGVEVVAYTDQNHLRPGTVLSSMVCQRPASTIFDPL